MIDYEDDFGEVAMLQDWINDLEDQRLTLINLIKRTRIDPMSLCDNDLERKAVRRAMKVQDDR